MAKIFLIALLGASLTAPAVRAIEFKPEFVTTENEGGFKHLEVVLKDGAARVIY